MTPFGKINKYFEAMPEDEAGYSIFYPKENIMATYLYEDFREPMEVKVERIVFDPNGNVDEIDCGNMCFGDLTLSALKNIRIFEEVR